MDKIIFHVATRISLKNSFTKFKLIYYLTQGYYSISLNNGRLFAPQGNNVPRDIKILGWCPVGPVLTHGEKVPL